MSAPVLASSTFSTFDLRFEKVTVPIPQLPPSLDGFRIAFATDLHVGENIPVEFLTDALKLLAAENADLMVWGGDYVGINRSRLASISSQLMHRKFHDRIPMSIEAKNAAHNLAPLLKIRGDAPSVAVRGNHEIWVAPEELDAVVRDSETALLINDTFKFSHSGHLIEVAGVDDFWNGVPRPPVFSSDAGLKILVSHNPDYVEVLERSELIDFHLALCGHTHGGQICLPAVGALTYNASSRFTKGLLPARAMRGSGLTPAVYTSRGLGVVELPFRLNCTPEITILTLRKV